MKPTATAWRQLDNVNKSLTQDPRIDLDISMCDVDIVMPE